jgi:branched-chain amino acid aminotransferase
MTDYVWWNGALTPYGEATVHASLLGAAGVSAVFEGIRGYASETGVLAFRIEDHLIRLGQSMRLMRMQPRWDLAELTAACTELVQANRLTGEDLYLRPMAYYTPSYRPTFELGDTTEILITASAAPSTPALGPPVTAGVSSYRRIRDDVMPPRVKNFSNYRNGQLAHTEVTLAGLDTALLLNSEGMLSEGTASCVFLVRAGQVHTPDLASGILDSITRASLITLLREQLGVTVHERRIERTELYLADEIFLAGTMMEIVPVGAVDHYQVGTGTAGAITRTLHELYARVVRGGVPNYSRWLTNLSAPHS